MPARTSGSGSNMGDREHLLWGAVHMLAFNARGRGRGRVVDPRDRSGRARRPAARSSTRPSRSTPSSSPRHCSTCCSTVERELGRTRDGPRFGPRTIDLDLLLYGDERRRRAGADRAASAAPRAPFRPGAARRARPRSRSAGHGSVQALLAGLQSASMSHLDELDEYEAELELRIKKEYSAVFGLFRYCVLTQDATYLCNKYDLEFMPRQPTRSSTWPWRTCGSGTRIGRRGCCRGPRCYTLGDVTVEELRGEGDEPQPDARGARRAHRRVACRRRRRVAVLRHAARSRRGQHADRLRALPRRRAARALAGRDRGAAHG